MTRDWPFGDALRDELPNFRAIGIGRIDTEKINDMLDRFEEYRADRENIEQNKRQYAYHCAPAPGSYAFGYCSQNRREDQQNKPVLGNGHDQKYRRRNRDQGA